MTKREQELMDDLAAWRYAFLVWTDASLGNKVRGHQMMLDLSKRKYDSIFFDTDKYDGGAR